ncbi:MAG TPA: P-loop NTPase fold protein [Beijerinckiaceae bacterium]|nr:P-loop NTPase fold protein [Beijerinckiaceae bacterium]
MPDFFLRNAQPEGNPNHSAERIPPTFSTEPPVPAIPGAREPASPVTAEELPAIYATDLPAGQDALGIGAVLETAADFLALRRTSPPLTIGLFGGRGSGKSFALGHLLDRVRNLASAAAPLGGGSPFLSRIVTVRIDAARAAGDPETCMAGEIYRTMVGSGADSHGALAHEAAQAARDPHVAAREAAERASEARHRLHAERQILHDLDGRRAKLAETVLYETAGSQVDAYARVNRSRIEARLRSFGFTRADPLDAYRDLVRDVAEAGQAGRFAIFLRALWAYRGQTKLLVSAMILLLVAWGLTHAGATLDAWLPSLSGGGSFGAALAGWIGDHRGSLGALATTALIAALVAVAACIWRAFRFTQPLFRGASLLKLDLETRRRDLDSLIANQTRRVDGIGTEADAYARRAEEAERRARAADSGPSPTMASLAESPFEPAPGEADHKARLAAAFVTSLDAAIARGDERAADAPQRILVAIDDLDALQPAQAAAFISTAHRLLSARNFAIVLAADADRLATAWGERYADELSKYVQLPIRLPVVAPNLYASFARSLLGETSARTVEQKTPDAGRSALDLPWRGGEADLLAALAPLAGHTPRAVKRFVNLYCLARLQAADYSAVALLIALETGGTPSERQAVDSALAKADPAAPLRIDGEPRLIEALDLCRAARGEALTAADIAAARPVVAVYSV